MEEWVRSLSWDFLRKLCTVTSTFCPVCLGVVTCPLGMHAHILLEVCGLYGATGLDFVVQRLLRGDEMGRLALEVTERRTFLYGPVMGCAGGGIRERVTACLLD